MYEGDKNKDCTCKRRIQQEKELIILFKGFSRNLKKRIIKTLIWSVLLYMVAKHGKLWNVDLVTDGQNQLGRSNDSNDKPCSETGWWTKISDQNHWETAKKLVGSYFPPRGKRPRGRRRFAMLDGVKGENSYTELKQMHRTRQDRDRWKQVMRKEPAIRQITRDINNAAKRLVDNALTVFKFHLIARHLVCDNAWFLKITCFRVRQGKIASWTKRFAISDLLQN